MGTHSPDRHELVVTESHDGADPDPQPVYELTPSAIIAVCEQCKCFWDFGSDNSQYAQEEFEQRHWEHLDHEPTGIFEASDYFDAEQLGLTAWTVTYDPCNETWKFDGEVEASVFEDVHTSHTGHDCMLNGGHPKPESRLATEAESDAESDSEAGELACG